MARQKALVTQHLENISREALERYQDIIKEYIRRRQGIYALYRRGKLYYVGLAGNLRVRLKAHLRDKHKNSWDHFSVYLTIGDEHMRELEAMLLRIVDPPGNKVKGKFAKSEDLLPRLRRSFRKNQQEEEARLLDGVKAPKKERAKTKKRAVQRSKTTGRRPVLAQYKFKNPRMKAIYKGKTYTARVLRDGTIRFDKQTYNSPSLAGKAIVGHGVNGWVFWRYERSPGDWVTLDHLRK